MDAEKLMAYLHAINVGEMDGIRVKLGEARQACRELDQPELAEKLDEAGAALDLADVKTFRKRVETVIARLGHVK